MIGRHRQQGVLAEVGPGKVASVTGAGLLILAAVVAHYGFPQPPWVVITLCCASLALTAFPIVLGALAGLARLRTNVDELVSIAIVASMFLGEWITAAVVAFIMVLGGLIEELTSERARRHLERLSDSQPEHVLVVDEAGAIREVPLARAQCGQHMVIRPGDVVPADGVVLEGSSAVDESMLTGESVPVAKGPADPISAGTINVDGSLRARIVEVGETSTQGRIRRLVAEAEQHRAPILRVAEGYAQWFTPAVLVLAGVVWLLSGDVERAVTMLVVGCPCAFVLATPTAVVAALGAASRHGVLVKGGKYLEACAKVGVIALDKTGTITDGRFRLRHLVRLGTAAEGELLAQAGRLESASEHPLGRAIVAEAERQDVLSQDTAAIARRPGLGVTEQGVAPGDAWSIGNQRFCRELGVPLSDSLSTQLDDSRRRGRTTLLLCRGLQPQALLELEDQVRREAVEVLCRLRKAGYERILMVTGDTDPVAQRVAQVIGIPAAEVHAGLLPEDKCQLIQRLEDGGARVCYVGDGVNDAPALAAASVGVSIAARENTVALETADAVLMRDGLDGLPLLLSMGQATARTINQNLIWFGLLFNAAMLVASGSGLLTPILGALGHNLGSVAVVLNSARLLRFKPSARGAHRCTGAGRRHQEGERASPPAQTPTC